MARGASFRSRSSETVSSAGIRSDCAEASFSKRKREREREVRRSLDGDERGV